AEPGYIEIRGDIRQRIQNEVPLHYTGMRQGELRFLAALATEYQDVQIDHARPPALAALRAAEAGLDRPQLHQQLARLEASQQSGDGIDVVRLRTRPHGTRRIQR